MKELLNPRATAAVAIAAAAALGTKLALNAFAPRNNSNYTLTLG